MPPLSEEQMNLIRKSTQIYRKDTLIDLYGEDEGIRHYKQTVSEVIAQLGKGSGKDYCATISVARIVYLLMCLKDPAAYYGKPPGDTIDILNIAINSDQAKNVFFKGLTTRIKRCPWFQGKYDIKANAIEFDKNITCYSGHSERESWEGYNTLVVILDEISGFALSSDSGNEQAKTADAIYKMYRGSVDSRFPDFGKVILLSFPRFQGDYIQQRFDSVVAHKEVVKRTHTFKLDPELPDGAEDNEFEIEWDEENVISYKIPNVFALKKPSWYVNPTRSLEDYKKAFWSDPVDALSRYACMPPGAIDAFFKSKEKIEAAFSIASLPFDENWRFKEWFRPLPDVEYFVHVDLAYKHDRCAVALAHVSKWSRTKIAELYDEPVPHVVIDAIRYWTPKSDNNVDFTEVKDYIFSLRQRGFHIKLVTFDRWESINMINDLKAAGMNSERLSVAKKHYEDLALLINEERIKGPAIEILTTELLQLRIIKGQKVDHPRKGYKDLSDAVCGAAYNAASLSKRNTEKIIEVHTHAPGTEQTNEITPSTAMKVPKRTPPTEIAEWLDAITVV